MVASGKSPSKHLESTRLRMDECRFTFVISTNSLAVTSNWYVYLIQSIPTGHLYTGIAIDPEIRLKQHNAGKGAKRTRAGRPWKLVWVHSVSSKGDALRLEAIIKKMNRLRKLALVQGKVLV
jgi:putative endonuclease